MGSGMAIETIVCFQYEVTKMEKLEHKEMYCRAREELLFYQNRVPTESSILSRQYVKEKLLAMENVDDYWVFDNH